MNYYFQFKELYMARKNVLYIFVDWDTQTKIPGTNFHQKSMLLLPGGISYFTGHIKPLQFFTSHFEFFFCKINYPSSFFFQDCFSFLTTISFFFDDLIFMLLEYY